MPKTRPPYAAEYRQQMVDLVRAGRTPEDLAREFEPSSQAIRTCERGQKSSKRDLPGRGRDPCHRKGPINIGLVGHRQGRERGQDFCPGRQKE